MAPFIWNAASDNAKILSYILAVAVGIIIGSFRTTDLPCNQVSIHAQTIVRYTNDTKQTNITVTKQSSRPLRYSKQRNLVMAAAFNTDLEAVYRLSRSIRGTSLFTTIVLIVSKGQMEDKNLKELADIYDVNYISFDEYFPAHLKKQLDDIKNIHSSRWIVFNNYLSSLQTKGITYDNVFICDGHDSLFQTDVFLNMTAYTPGVFAFLEDVGMKIGTCPVNSKWIKMCYGDADLEKIFNKSISCSGTVAGTWSAMRSYLATMEYQILNTPVACKNYLGSDQGIHNYIIHNNKVPNTTIHQLPHEYGFVGTLGYAPWLKRNQFGLILNLNRTIYAVIHQYGRSYKLIEQYQREYKIIPEDERERKQ